MRSPIVWLAERAFFVLVLASPAAAQEIRGIVRDSATHLPVLGAVVMLLDAADAVVGRNLTNQRGEYHVSATHGGARLRVLRLGFRPRVLQLPPQTNGIEQIDVIVTAIPVTLESVRTVAAASCPQRSDGSAALALLEQARSGLLTTIVSRGVKPARMTRLLFDRHFDGSSERITQLRVRVDSAVTTASFGAVRSAVDFVKHGFLLDSAGVRTFFAPDAETLLDDGFTGGYCFRIMDAERSRPHQIGLGFRGADGHRDRVDIDGALWIDTLARALIDVEFRYVGLDRVYEPYQPGGRVSFQAMPNGAVLVDRWTLRIVDPRENTVGTMLKGVPGAAVARCTTNMCFKGSVSAQYDVHEVGGELARAVWDDGVAWKGALGRLVAHAAGNEPPVGTHTVMKLEGTEYQALSDANGDVAFDDLIPGPYELVVVDPKLSQLGIALATGMSFVAARDSTLSVRVMPPDAEDYAAQVCAADEGTSGTAWIFGRVTTPDGRPVGGATWAMQRSLEGGWEDVAQGLTGADGTFHYCRLGLGTVVRVTAVHRGASEASLVQTVAERLTIIKLEMKPR